MVLPLKYNLRNLRVRWRSSLATVLGIGFVVAVFIMVMALASGLKATYLSTEDSPNLLVIRKGALAESSSQITMNEVRRAKYLEGIARDQQGDPIVSAEVIVLITMERSSGGRAHVQVRGLSAPGVRLRPRIRIVEGREFRRGMRECIVSRTVAQRFKNCRLGQAFRSGKHTWKVVGIFDAQKTAYDSEIWVDADEAREAFNRSFYCSIVILPVDDAAAAALVNRIEADRQMHLRVLTEAEYYLEQAETAEPIRLFGFCLASIMGIGAVFFAMNIMYASVGARTREIGTLRVLGFDRRSIYLSFMLESLLVAVAGGALGCLLALPVHGIATGTFNWKTFAEVAFEFRITAELLAGGMVFAAVMGLVGGLLPARLAARRPVLDALHAD